MPERGEQPQQRPGVASRVQVRDEHEPAEIVELQERLPFGYRASLRASIPE